MAKTAKPAPENELPAKKTSLKLFVLMLLASSAIGLAGGFGVAAYLATSHTGEEVQSASVNTNGTDEAPAEGKEQSAAAKDQESQTEANKEANSAVANNEHGQKAANGTPDADSKHSEEDNGAEAAHDGPSLVSLEPVIINISDPSTVWVRLESVLKASHTLPEETATDIHQDFMAFFRTLRLEDLEGGSSYTDLKAELLSRANVRADNSIEAIYFKTFLFE